MGESDERCESRLPRGVLAKDPARRHSGRWSPLRVLAVALVLTGLGGVPAFGRVGGVSSFELISIVIVLLLALTLVSSHSRKGGRPRPARSDFEPPERCRA